MRAAAEVAESQEESLPEAEVEGSLDEDAAASAKVWRALLLLSRAAFGSRLLRVFHAAWPNLQMTA